MRIKNPTTTKVTERTLYALRILAAYSGQPQYAIMERLVETELAQVEAERVAAYLAREKEHQA